MILSTLPDDAIRVVIDGPPDNSSLYNGGFLIAGALIALLAQLLTSRYQREAEDRRKWHDDYARIYRTVKDQVSEFTFVHGINAGDRHHFNDVYLRMEEARKKLEGCADEVQLIGSSEMYKAADSIHKKATDITDLASRFLNPSEDEKKELESLKDDFLHATRSKMKIKE